MPRNVPDDLLGALLDHTQKLRRERMSTDRSIESLVCPGCEMADSDGPAGWVTHRGQQWHEACVAVEAAEKAGLL